mmetsp:Transcript_59268/g.111042  ORF Transcript_59268/g.111042 Transcript_59268/m.111042 type:complete len:217 (+) Transcript_59268:747-1397(+)
MSSTAFFSRMGRKAAASGGDIAFTKGERYTWSSVFEMAPSSLESRQRKTARTACSIVPLKNTDKPAAHSPKLKVPFLSKSIESNISYSSSRSRGLCGTFCLPRSITAISTKRSFVNSLVKIALLTCCWKYSRPSKTGTFRKGDLRARSPCFVRLSRMRLRAFQGLISYMLITALALPSKPMTSVQPQRLKKWPVEWWFPMAPWNLYHAAAGCLESQ